MAKSEGKKSIGTKSAQARILSSRVSYRGPVFSVTTDDVEEPGGVRARRDVIRHSGSVVVLAVDVLAVDVLALDDATSDGPVKAARKAEPRLLLERQYRHAAQSMMWELPAGRIDDGKSRPEPDERIAIRFFPLSEAKRMALNGRIRDAKTISGILWLAQMARPAR